MPPRRGRGKAAAKGASERAKSAPKRAARRKKKDWHLPPELWRMVIGFACDFPREFDWGVDSVRAKAALGLFDMEFDYQQYVRRRHEALQMRRTVLLVSKTWNEMGKDHTYTTIVVNDKTRQSIPSLITKFLAQPKLADGVKRLELNFKVNRNSIECMASMVRGLVNHCKNLECVDDHLRREASKRSVSPIEVASQANGEIPFAVAVGNRSFRTIEHARFSKDSAAAFTLHYFSELMRRLSGITILSLADFPVWGDLPVAHAAGGAGNDGGGNSRARARAAQRRRRSDEDEDESSDSSSDEDDDSEGEADNEDEKELEPLKFEYVHTLNLAHIRETETPRYANAFTRYIAGWEVPDLQQLALSIYNVECIPTALLKQYGDQLICLSLHAFRVPPTPTPTPGAAGAIPDAPTGRSSTMNKTLTLEDRKAILPSVTTVMVIPSSTSADWVDTFSCPQIDLYVLSYCPYNPTPHDPTDPGTTSQRAPWSAKWSHLRAHLELALDRTKMPKLSEVWLQDCEFLDAKDLHEEVKKFWEKWEGRLAAVGVKLTGGKGVPGEERHGALTWTQAKKIWEPIWLEEQRIQKEKAARKAEEKRVEMEKKAQEAKKLEEAKKVEEAKKAEKARKAEEAKKKASAEAADSAATVVAEEQQPAPLEDPGNSVVEPNEIVPQTNGVAVT